MKLAVEYKIETLAFAAISTGINFFPIERAAKIAGSTVKEFLMKDDSID
ncbi:MAG: macro domain-containing protein [Bacteroidota bacterium]